jgi:hypothetical protein
MSSLIYALLREERNNQEETMLTAYANNMRGGTTRNSFTSGGATSPATADSVYNWYVSQANLAKSTGDNASYERLMQRAEQFRLSSLKDQEDLARNSYGSGTSVDRSLFGLSGTGTLELAEYEKILNNIANDSAMTESDRSRIRLTLFNASYESTASDLVRKYQEKRISADSLVSFYDKELERAKAAGITESSQSYQDILNARSRAIQAQKADAAQGRVDAVRARVKSEQLTLATALQSLLEPVVASTFKSQKTIDALSANVEGDGLDYITTLINALQNETGLTLSQLIERAGLQSGMDAATVEELQTKFSDYADEVDSLYRAGFVDETAQLRKITMILTEGSARGIYGATMREASKNFADYVTRTGGSTSIPFSSDPYAYRGAFKEWASTAATVSGNDRYEDILFADQVARISSGDLTDLLPGFEGSDIAGLVEQIASTTGLDIQTVGKALGVLSSGSDAAWGSQDSAIATVAQQLNSLSGGTIQSNLRSAVSTSGGLTVGDIMSGAVQTYMTDVVDKDPNLVWAYQFEPRTKQNEFVPVDTPTVANDDSYVATTATGKGSEIVYVKRQQMQDENGGLIPNMYYVPVPGGSNFAGTTNQSMDNNDYIEFVSGGNTFKLTLQDLEDFRTFSGTSGQTPAVGLDAQNRGVIQIGKGLYQALVSPALLNQWLNVTFVEKGQEWYDTRVSVGKDTTGFNQKVDNLANDYATKIRAAIGPTYDGDLASVVKSYLARFGITDKTGKLTGLVSTKLDSMITTRQETSEYAAGLAPIGGRSGRIAPEWNPPSSTTPPVLDQSWNNAAQWYNPMPIIPTRTDTSNRGIPDLGGGLPANSVPVISTGPIGMSGARDQLGGQDWFFRNLGGSAAITEPAIITPPTLARGTVRGLGEKKISL